MDHIEDNKRNLNETTYWRTADKNIVIAISSVQSEIYVDKVRDQVSKLESHIESIKPVSLPEDIKLSIKSFLSNNVDGGDIIYDKINSIVESSNTELEDMKLLTSRLTFLKQLLNNITENV